MRRLARRLFTLCSAVSLLLCVAVCVLWVRSYWVYDQLAFLRPPRADRTRLVSPAPLWFTSVNGGLGMRLGPRTSVSADRGDPPLGRVWHARSHGRVPEAA